jgi:hypothetical protein
MSCGTELPYEPQCTVVADCSRCPNNLNKDANGLFMDNDEFAVLDSRLTCWLEGKGEEGHNSGIRRRASLSYSWLASNHNKMRVGGLRYCCVHL